MLCSTLWPSFTLFLKLLPTFAMWSLSSTTDTLAFSDTNFQISKAYIFLFFNFLLVEDKIYSMSALLVFLSISNKIFPEVDAKLFDKYSLCISTQILSFQNVSVSAMLPLQTYCCVQLFKHEFQRSTSDPSCYVTSILLSEPTHHPFNFLIFSIWPGCPELQNHMKKSVLLQFMKARGIL